MCEYSHQAYLYRCSASWCVKSPTDLLRNGRTCNRTGLSSQPQRTCKKEAGGGHQDLYDYCEGVKRCSSWGESAAAGSSVNWEEKTRLLMFWGEKSRPANQTMVISANTPLRMSLGTAGRCFHPATENPFSPWYQTLKDIFWPRGEHMRGCHFVKVECEAPEDGDVNLNARRVVILQPGTQVEEARKQQVEGWHQHSHEEQTKLSKFSLDEVSLRIHSSRAEQVLNVPWGCLRNGWKASAQAV